NHSRRFLEAQPLRQARAAGTAQMDYMRRSATGTHATAEKRGAEKEPRCATGQKRIPSSKTVKRDSTLAATCAGSPWTASATLDASPATRSRSRDTDRSTYMTLHGTLSIVVQTSAQSCDQERFRHGG